MFRRSFWLSKSSWILACIKIPKMRSRKIAIYGVLIYLDRHPTCWLKCSWDCLHIRWVLFPSSPRKYLLDKWRALSPFLRAYDQYFALLLTSAPLVGRDRFRILVDFLDAENNDRYRHKTFSTLYNLNWYPPIKFKNNSPSFFLENDLKVTSWIAILCRRRRNFRAVARFYMKGNQRSRKVVKLNYLQNVYLEVLTISYSDPDRYRHNSNPTLQE